MQCSFKSNFILEKTNEMGQYTSKLLYKLGRKNLMETKAKQQEKSRYRKCKGFKENSIGLLAVCDLRFREIVPM